MEQLQGSDLTVTEAFNTGGDYISSISFIFFHLK